MYCSPRSAVRLCVRLCGGQLHKQQFLELVRRGDRMGVVQYASEHLSAMATVPGHVTEIQQVRRRRRRRRIGLACWGRRYQDGDDHPWRIGRKRCNDPSGRRGWLSCLPPPPLWLAKQAMATRAFDKPEACPVPEYGRLFSDDRW